MTNPYCRVLGIDVPDLDRVSEHEEAGPYSLLITALLERGAPMTLAEVAQRFDEAGVAPAEAALRSLKRCRPARAPVHRDGDHYALDPHDDELVLWAFRLGLLPPRVPSLRIVRPEPDPLPGLETPVTVDEIAEAWSGAPPCNWSAQRVALTILDAHGRALEADEVVAFSAQHCRGASLDVDAALHWHAGSAVRVRADGRWEVEPAHPALVSARKALRERIALARRYSALRPDPAQERAAEQARERRRAAHAAQLAALRRVLVHVFPVAQPEAAVLLDPAAREIRTFRGPELERVRERLRDYDLVAALDVRGTLRRLGLDPEGRRLAELGPPQKTLRLNKQGRTLRITTRLLIQGSCGIARPLGEPRKLCEYLRTGQDTRLRRRLEADAKALHALYEYGRLHGALRLRWGFLDEMLPVSWVHSDEMRLYRLMTQACEQDRRLEVIAGSAPGWSDPWARAQRCRVEQDVRRYGFELIDEDGMIVDQLLVQRARLER